MFENTALEGVYHVYLAAFLGFTTLGFSFYRNCIQDDKIFEEKRKEINEEFERRRGSAEIRVKMGHRVDFISII
ncbi:TPA: hypothetical protein QCZ17_004166 [Bacillus cereus]|nr:hypothetical protein [Bacillus cereus]